MKVLVTGALGNIGSHTMGTLLQEGHAVVAFDLESPRARKLAARLDGDGHMASANRVDELEEVAVPDDQEL